MAELLYQVQQFASFVVFIWPIWLIIGVLFIAVGKVNWFEGKFSWIFRVFFVVLTLLLWGLRLIYFLVQPYSYEKFPISRNTNSLQIEVTNTEFQLQGVAADSAAYIISYAPRGHFILQDNPVSHFQKFSAKSQLNAISRRDSKVWATLNESGEKSLQLALRNNSATIDLQQTSITKLKLFAQESDVTIKIPTEDAQYELDIRNVQSEILLLVANDATLNIKDKTGQLDLSKYQLEKLDGNTWRKEGRAGLSITITISSSRQGLALAFRD